MKLPISRTKILKLVHLTYLPTEVEYYLPTGLASLHQCSLLDGFIGIYSSRPLNCFICSLAIHPVCQSYKRSLSLSFFAIPADPDWLTQGPNWRSPTALWRVKYSWLLGIFPLALASWPMNTKGSLGITVEDLDSAEDFWFSTFGDSMMEDDGTSWIRVLVRDFLRGLYLSFSYYPLAVH